MKTIGARVKALRQSKRLSQKALADRCGVSQATVANIERGRTTEIKGYVLTALARELTSTEQFILDGPDNDGHESDLMWAELTAIWRALLEEDRQALIRAARGMHSAMGRASEIDPFPAHVAPKLPRPQIRIAEKTPPTPRKG